MCLILSAVTYRASQTFADPDLWGHVRFGQDILDSGVIVQTDHYSYLTSEQKWINHEWLSEVLFAWAFGLGGAPALVSLKTGVVLLTLGLVYLHLVRHGLAPLPAGVVVILVTALLTPFVIVVRPQIFTYALFGVLLALLDAADRGRTRYLWGVPIVFAAWVNLHGGVLAGLGVFLLWSAVRLAASLGGGRRPGLADGLFAATAAGALAATLINPYGVRLLVFLARPETVRRPDIIEWQPTAVMSPYGMAYLALLGVAVAGLIYTRSPRRPIQVVLVLGSALLPLTAHRHGPLFALAAALMAGEHLGDAWRRLRSPGRSREGRWSLMTVLAAGGAASLLWLSVANLRCIGVDPVVGIGYPARAVAVLRASEVEGNLAVPFTWGEYTLWHLAPRIKVSVDGRRETVYPDGVLRENLRFTMGVGDWSALVRDRATDMVLADRISAAANLMSLLPGWVRAYEDGSTAIFARQGSAHEARIRAVVPPAVPADGAGLCFP